MDPETGKVTVQKLDTVHDVATILHPVNHQGQIDGGIMQGIGYVLTEELLIDEGRGATANLGEYKSPNVRDVVPLRTTGM